MVNYSSKRFLLSMFITVVILLSCIGILTYLVDPFFKYRYKADSTYLINPRFANPGLLKNYDYNTVILGSSMVQNFDMNLFRLNPDVKPLKIGIGAANRDEIELAYSLIRKEKTKSVIISLDLTMFNAISKDVKYPSYTYKEDLLSQLAYLYSYEACIRYLLVDIGAYFLYGVNNDVSQMMQEKSNVDKIGDFRIDRNFYNKKGYLRFQYRTENGFSYQDTINMDKRMRDNFVQFITKLEINNNKHIEYTFILPPYSIAYWGYIDKKGYYQTFLKIIQYITRELSIYDNARIVCFYNIDTVTNLDNYADLTHFSPETSDFIVKNLNTRKYELNIKNIDYTIQKLDSMVSVFNNEYAEWKK